jgi:AcrR family transcriptional regulator
MPKIMAATVKEHHAMRHQALLDAAKTTLLDPQLRTLNFEHVGPRAGLRRNSVYLYFPSENDLALALADELLPELIAKLARAVERQATPREQLTAYVKALVTKDSRLPHLVLRNLESRTRESVIAERVSAEYRALAGPLVAPLTGLGLAEPEHQALVLAAMLSGVLDLIERGIDARALQRRTMALVETIVGAAA